MAKGKSESTSQKSNSALKERQEVNLEPHYYIPWLRWKQGEYLALRRLSSVTKDSIVPLIEVPEIGFDFEAQTLSKSVDEHLEHFARRVKQNWGSRPCYVDMRLIDVQDRMANGQHPAEFVFNDLRSEGAVPTPVITPSPDAKFERVIKDVAAADGRGLCLRVGIVEAASEDLKATIDGVLRRSGLSAAECDFILDVGAPSFRPIQGFAGLVEGIIGRIPHLNHWQSFALIGTSFPSSMSQVPSGLSAIPRYEWQLYKRLVPKIIAVRQRIPNFGDYGINHPGVLELDMRLVKPYASLRYTIDDNWLLAKGKNTRDYGLGQFAGLCQSVVESQSFEDRGFSKGDEYIYDCAQGLESTGNLTTWRWVGTNHHLEKIVRDLANFVAA